MTTALLIVVVLSLTNLNLYSQNQTSQILTYKNLNEIVKPQYFILDTIVCDYNNDKIEDLILVTDLKTRNKENAQHEAPLPILILKGTNSGFVLWKKNEQVIEDLDDNCPADGYQKIVSKLNFFTIESTVCQDNFYLTHFTTFKYNKEINNIVLHKFGLKKTNRQNPNQKYTDKIYTEKDFGLILFQNFQIETLKSKLMSKGK